MIYFDNAATTFPKPQQVSMAVSNAMRSLGANPGRAGHDLSMAAAEEIFGCRSDVAEFFHAAGPECVVFTLNCTQAVNMVLKGVLKPGDHVVTSCLEHNAVMRPLHVLQEKGISISEATVVPGDNNATVDAFRQAFRSNTRLVICTHASNVWGIRLPVERIAALAHEYGISMAVDCAQSAGVLPIDMTGSGIDYICVAAHKGLYAPMGTGILIAAHGEEMDTLIEGGTGTNSISLEQPHEMPERLESGTPNLPGISGLRAGVKFVSGLGLERIRAHEMALVQSLYYELVRMRRVKLYTAEPHDPYFVPVLSFNVDDVSSEVVAQRLNEKGIAVRSGLHCAPRAHEFMGTLQQGSVRVCPSVFSSTADVRYFSASLSKIIGK